MYIHLKKGKIVKFLVLIGGVLVLVLLTLIFKSDEVKKYLNLNYIGSKIESSIKSFAYEHNFFSDDHPTAQSLKFTSQAIPVLLYHGIVSTPGQFTITKAQFTEEMTSLKNAGYSTITLADLNSFLNGKKELPAKSFLLTFDDARQDSYIGADSVLKSLGFNAVMFVPTADVLNSNNVGDGYYLTEDQLNVMVASGTWELGSHAMQQTSDNVAIDANNSRADFLSNKMWLPTQKRVETDQEYETRIDKELTQSKVDLQQDFKNPITAFAYPSSDYGQLSTNNIKNATSVILKYITQNYQMAFQQVSPTDNQYTLNYPGDNMYYLHRIEPASDWNGTKLLNVLAAAQVKALPDNNMFGTDNAWKKIWGEIAQNPTSISLTTTISKSSSGAFLDGTKNWKDYEYQTTVSGDPVEAVTLYARYQDADNYLSCTFTSSYVKISETVNGSTSKLTQLKYTTTTTSKDSVYGMAVNDQDIVCSKEGVTVIGTTHDNRVIEGGIGLSVWDPVAINRSIVFSNITAQEVSSLVIPPKVTVIVPPKPLPPTKPIPVVPPVKPGNTTTGSTTTTTPDQSTPEPTAPAISLPYDVTNFSISTAWKNILGQVKVKQNEVSKINYLVVSAPSDNTGGFAELPGSEGWGNYSFALKTNFISGTSFSLIARYVDSKNYTSCTFETQGYARIDSIVNGKTTKIVELKKQIATIPGNVNGISYSMAVDGNQVQCIVEGQPVVGTVPNMPANGGIGIKSYNKALGTSELDVQEVKITSL